MTLELSQEGQVGVPQAGLGDRRHLGECQFGGAAGCRRHGRACVAENEEGGTESADERPGGSCQGSETVPSGDTYPLQQEYFPTSISDHYL